MIDELNVRRAVLLYAAGALAGLGIAGYGLFTASGTTTHSVPPEDMALINQRPILRSDFITQLETETGKTFGSPRRAQKLRVLDEMVREELRVQRGLELDYAETDQDTRNAPRCRRCAEDRAMSRPASRASSSCGPTTSSNAPICQRGHASTVCNLLLPLPPAR